jgi:hypothetical protein
MKKCVFTACTINYLDRAISLYNSLNKYNKNIFFCVYLINTNQDNYFQNNKNDNLIIKYDNTNLIDDKLKVYASCLRIRIFKELIDEFDILFWMDADTIIRANLDKMFEFLNNNDLTLYKNTNNIHVHKIGEYKTGIVGIKKSKLMIEFINNWNKILLEYEYKWFIDQLSITKLINNTKGIKIKILPKEYIDWDFEEKSFIWVGKGERKNTQKYLNEENKYNNNNNMIDLYYDRNMEDNIIGSTLKSIEKYFNNNKLNVNKEWGKIKKTCDINIHWGIKCVYKPNTHFREVLMNNYKYNIIIEQGFLNRKYYRSFGINGFAGLSKIMPKNSPKDRFEMLNIKIKDMKINNDGYILFCGQLPWDTQVQNINYNDYINNIFTKLKKITNKEIVFRHHPLFKPRGKFNITLPKYVKKDENNSLLDSLKDAYCVISYNSTSLVECILEGKPIIALDKMSIVYDLGTSDINNINKLYIPDKKKILQKMYDISYMQYTEKEFENGTAINFIKKLIV